ncbi:MAG: M23 family metallopeptidase [Alphaproteobacteria bacterium]
MSGPLPIKEDSNLRTVRLVLDVGDTLIAKLREAGTPYQEAYGASKALAPILDLRKLKAGQVVTLTLRIGGKEAREVHLESLALVPETDRMVLVEHQEKGRFRASPRAVEHAPRLISVVGYIATSLYDAARARGVPTSILRQAYGSLGHIVDFQRDIRAGDMFVLGYEILDDGKDGGSHPGNLVYALLTLGDRTISGFRYTTSDGYTGLFDPEGRSIEASLMKTPVEGGRLSSLFGQRDHPVLGYTRKHKGLDFAAPRGAAILAAGDGIIERRSRNGSFGKYVRIRHDSKYATAYAHLDRYADGLARGALVRQGDVIGYVGTTGLATGPNLHYAVLADGIPVNPMSLGLPTRRILDGEEKGRFLQAITDLRASLKSARAPANDRADADATRNEAVESAKGGDGRLSKEYHLAGPQVVLRVVPIDNALDRLVEGFWRGKK